MWSAIGRGQRAAGGFSSPGNIFTGKVYNEVARTKGTRAGLSNTLPFLLREEKEGGEEQEEEEGVFLLQEQGITLLIRVSPAQGSGGGKDRFYGNSKPDNKG